MKEIKAMPNIEHYPQIIEAAKTGRLVIFVGAGVSAAVGLPSWSGFANKRLDYVYKRGFINFRTMNQLADLSDPKKVLSICESIINEKIENGDLNHNDLNDYNAQNMFKVPKDKKEKYKQVYENLYSTNAIFVTTNFDECLDIQVRNKYNMMKSKIKEASDKQDVVDMYQNEIVFLDSDFLSSKLVNGNILHIHGSISDETTMLITLTHYLETYSQKGRSKNLLQLLDRLFNSDYTILFIGYSLEEMEILELMLSKSNEPEKVKKHYMLYNSYKEDEKLTNHLANYYSKFSTELIPYDMTEKGYDQLVDIIESWSKYLSKISKSRDYARKMRLVDFELEKSNSDFEFAIESVCDLINQDRTLEVYLFKKLSECDFPIPWFEKLDDKGFFAPDYVPNLELVENGYRVHHWSPTNYLVRLSEVHHDDNQVVTRLLRIINEISLYTDVDGYKIENYHVHLGLISVLGNIDTRFITNDIISSIELWKYKRIQNDLIINQINERLVPKLMDSEEGVDHSILGWIVVLLLRLFAISNSKQMFEYYFENTFSDEFVQNVVRKCGDVFIEEIERIIKEKLNEKTRYSLLEYEQDQYVLVLSFSTNIYKVQIVTTEEPYSFAMEKNSNGYKVIKEYSVATKNNFEELVLNIFDEIAKDYDVKKFSNDLKKSIEHVLYSFLREGTYRSFNKSMRYYSDGYEAYIDLLVRSIDELDNNKSYLLFERYSKENLFLFQKIALYGIGIKHDKCISVFWEMLESDRSNIIFGDLSFGDELRVVLDSITEISKEHSDLLLLLIDNGPSIRYAMDDVERYTDIWRLKRLNALLKIEEFKNLRDEIKSKFNNDFHPLLSAAIGPVQVGVYASRTPITIDEMMKMTIQELNRFLDEFVEEDRFDGPSVKGLGNTLKTFVEFNPEKIASEIDCFLKQDYEYVNQILNGLNVAWKKGNEFNWKKVLNFIYDYINDCPLLTNMNSIKNLDSQETLKWVLFSVSSLIESGCQNDMTSFDSSNYEVAKSIILQVIGNLQIEEDINVDNGYLLFSINTLHGNYIETLIYLSLYGKRNDLTKNEWDKDLEKVFLEMLKKNTIEAYCLLGLYSINIEYLNDKFLYDQISKLEIGKSNFEAFLEGFLTGNLNKKLFGFMKDHFFSAFSYNFKNKDINGLIARHLYIALLNSFEDAENLVFDQLIKVWNIEILSKLLWEIYRGIPNDDVDPTTKLIIERFIKSVGNRIMKTPELTQSEKSLMSECIHFLQYIDPFDDCYKEFYKKAIQYSEFNYNTNDAIDIIHMYAGVVQLDSEKNILADFFDVMTDYTLPYYPEDKIYEIIEYFFNWKINDVTDKATKICNKYFSGDRYFLKNLCDEHLI